MTATRSIFWQLEKGYRRLIERQEELAGEYTVLKHRRSVNLFLYSLFSHILYFELDKAQLGDLTQHNNKK